MTRAEHYAQLHRPAKARKLLAEIDRQSLLHNQPALSGDAGAKTMENVFQPAHWAAIADAVHVGPPSPETIALVVEMVRERGVHAVRRVG